MEMILSCEKKIICKGIAGGHQKGCHEDRWKKQKVDESNINTSCEDGERGEGK